MLICSITPPSHLITTSKNPPKTLKYYKPKPLLLLTKPQEALETLLNSLQTSLNNNNNNIKIDDDPSLFSSLLESLFKLNSPLRHVTLLHSLIPPPLLRSHPSLSFKLLRLYSRHPSHLPLAHQLFDQIPHRRKHPFAWNSLISAYARAGLYVDALALYYQMVEEDDVKADRFTFPRALAACAGLGSLPRGEDVLRRAVRCGFHDDPFVLNALVDMYAKCGDIVKARKVFGRISHRDYVSWNSMIGGYFRHGLMYDALDTFRDMLKARVEPYSVTLSAVLARTVGKTALEIHCFVLRRGQECNLSVSNSLVKMYSDRDKLNQATYIFNSMEERDLVSWNVIISAHRRDYRVLALFRDMEKYGPRPDRVTFVAVLSACANLGMVEDGMRLFRKMRDMYKIEPGNEHYGCVVNMLGRAGLIDEAYELVSKERDVGPTVWGALLYACSVHGNVGVGEVAAEKLFELEPDNEHNFELLMKIYRNVGRFEDVRRVRRLMKERGL